MPYKYKVCNGLFVVFMWGSTVLWDRSQSDNQATSWQSNDNSGSPHIASFISLYHHFLLPMRLLTWHSYGKKTASKRTHPYSMLSANGYYNYRDGSHRAGSGSAGVRGFSPLQGSHRGPPLTWSGPRSTSTHPKCPAPHRWDLVLPLVLWPLQGDERGGRQEGRGGRGRGVNRSYPHSNIWHKYASIGTNGLRVRG